jgi:hypothetical protein
MVVLFSILLLSKSWSLFVLCVLLALNTSFHQNGAELLRNNFTVRTAYYDYDTAAQPNILFVTGTRRTSHNDNIRRTSLNTSTEISNFNERRLLHLYIPSPSLLIANHDTTGSVKGPEQIAFNLTFIGPCIVICSYNKSEQDS